MLLMIEALLFISAAVGQDPRTDAADGQIFPLDMAENSVDDLYVGCKTNMADQVKTVLLENELNRSLEFKTVWQNGEMNATIPSDNLTRNHSVAIYVYTNSHFNLYQDFNNAVRTDKQNYQDKTFPWYSLFFYLAEAIQILKEMQNGCKLTYRGTNLEFDENVLNTEVRFGQFASSSLDRTYAEVFGNKSCFEITTCEGADLANYSTFPEEKEVLIPPYEKFSVTEVKRRKDHEDLWCETVYVLKSTGVRSDLNCAFFRNQAETSKTSAFNSNAFYRCVHQKLCILHSRYIIYQSEELLRGYFVQNQQSRHRVYPINRGMNCAFFRNQAETSKTLAFNSNAFYRCVHQKLCIMHSRYAVYQSEELLRGYFVQNQQSRDSVYPVNRGIHYVHQNNQKWLCYQFLHSLRINRNIQTLLMPCCKV